MGKKPQTKLQPHITMCYRHLDQYFPENLQKKKKNGEMLSLKVSHTIPTSMIEMS